ncbi:hypothetical protein Taro_022027, partial [Colocasia esculenta]|nr:hypothetical protein [Colocasia esculenta]
PLLKRADTDTQRYKQRAGRERLLRHLLFCGSLPGEAKAGGFPPVKGLPQMASWRARLGHRGKRLSPTRHPCPSRFSAWGKFGGTCAAVGAPVAVSRRARSMDDRNRAADENLENYDGEDDFRSCCAEDEEWKEAEEHVEEGPRDELDEFSVKMFFKGVSVCDTEGSASGVSGIGVVMERSSSVPVFRVQKKLHFCVEPSVAELLALLDGLLEALRDGKVRRVFAYTDSESVSKQIADGGSAENELFVALGQRIMEHTDKLEAFVLNLVSSCELEEPLHLAQEAAGVFPLLLNGDGSFKDCSICHGKRHPSCIVTMNCLHKFCSDCMTVYIQGRLEASQVPVSCPHLRCDHYISPSECRSFLPIDCYESFERTLVVAEAHNFEGIHCPFPNCLALLIHDRSTVGEDSSNQSDDNCIECQECHRLVCIDCGVPWHLSMTCEEYQNLPAEERHAADNALHHLANDNNWRRCQHCRRMIERTDGCYYMSCCRALLETQSERNEA